MRSEAIRNSVKEWLKSGNHIIPHELENLLQYHVDPSIREFLSPRIVKRYKEGALAVQLRTRVKTGLLYGAQVAPLQ
jgi:hypothetical protein